jgi:hypothetical protein
MAAVVQWQFMTFDTRQSPDKKKFKVTPSCRKVMLTVFWDQEGKLLTAFQPQGQTVNADSYRNILAKLHKAIQQK